MEQLLNYLYVAIVVVLMFGASIFIHEFGHFWVARRRGMKVEAFAIGFGPKICSWTRDGIDYSLRWIPAGGFVKLPQMITSQALEGANASAPLPPASPLSKILVALAGPVMNVFFAFFIATVIYFVGLPVPLNPSVVGNVEPGSPEAKMGIREGDRIVSVNGRPVRTWDQINELTIVALTNVVPVVIERDSHQSTFYLTLVNSEIGGKFLNLDPKDHPTITQIAPKSPAEKSGLKVNDEFVSFDNVPIVNQDQLVALIHQRASKPTALVVRRGSQRISLTVVPELDTAKNEGRIGVLLLPNLVYEVQRPGPLPWDQVSLQVSRTLDTLGALFHSRQTGVGIQDLSGPPGILAMLFTEVNTDLRLALSFLVLLNVNLAILNMVPIPVLDGGHIIIALVEKIRRRPLSLQFVEYTTTAFAVLLLTFMAYVSFNDVTRRFGFFRAMFNRNVTIEQPVQPSPAAPRQP